MGDYWLRLAGPNPVSFAEIELDCDSGQDAISIASSLSSPAGHVVHDGRSFLAWFGDRWGEDLEETDGGDLQERAGLG